MTSIPSTRRRASATLGSALAALLLTGSLTAQTPVDPEATALLEAVLQARAERLEGVENYTVVQAMNGFETTLYFERVDAEGYVGFRVVPPHEYESERLERAGFGGPVPGGGVPGGSGPPGDTPVAPGTPDDLGPAGEPAGAPMAPAGAPGGGLQRGPPGMPDLSSLSERLPPLPGPLSNLPGAASGPSQGLKDLVGGLPGKLPGGGNLPGNAPGADRGGDRGGSVLQRALGAAAEGAAGGAQQRLMQKGMESLLSSTSDDGTAEIALEAELVRAIMPRARLAGTDEVDGQRCRLLEVTDLDGIQFGEGSEDFSPTHMTMCVDPEERVFRRSVLEGDARLDGEMHPLRIEILEQDHRQVESMVEPFRRVIRVSGMMEAMAAADPEQMADMRKAMEQMEQMEEQLARMPPEQRRMVEAQMGPMREQMQRMMGGMEEGGAMEMLLEIRDLRVNQGPPDPLGTAELRLEGSVALELSGLLPRVSEIPEVADGETIWQVELLGRAEDGRTVLLQLYHTGDLPASGRAPATARLVVSGTGGPAAGFGTEEGAATLVVTSRTQGAAGPGAMPSPGAFGGVPGSGRISATFEFEAAGEVETDGERRPARVTVRGSLEAPVASDGPDRDMF